MYLIPTAPQASVQEMRSTKGAAKEGAELPIGHVMNWRRFSGYIPQLDVFSRAHIKAEARKEKTRKQSRSGNFELGVIAMKRRIVEECEIRREEAEGTDKRRWKQPNR